MFFMLIFLLPGWWSWPIPMIPSSVVHMWFGLCGLHIARLTPREDQLQYPDRVLNEWSD